MTQRTRIGSTRFRSALPRRDFLSGFTALALGLALPRVGLARGEAFASPQRLWQRASGNATLVPMAFQGGHLYTAGDATLAAWDAETGERLWRAPLSHRADFRLRVSPAGLLVAGRAHIGVWDLERGQMRWERAAGAGRAFATPLVHGARILVALGPKLTEVQDRRQAFPPTLLALDARTGEELWRFATTPGTGVFYAPVAWRDRIFFAPGDGRLYALSAEKGQLLWQRDGAARWQYLRQLHMSGDVIVAGGYWEHLYGLSAEDGRELWRFYAGNFINSHLVHDGAAYFWSPTGWIYAVDCRNGERLWRHRTTDYRKGGARKTRNWGPVLAELQAMGPYLYSLDMRRRLHVLDRSSGKKVRDYRLSHAVRPFVCLGSSPDRIFLGGTEGDVFSYLLPGLV